MPKILPKPWYKKILDKLALKYKKDYRVIEYVTQYPFSFLRDVIADDINPRPVRIRHFGAFIPRHPDIKEIVKENRLKTLRQKLYLLVEADLYKDEEEALEALNNMSNKEIHDLYRRFYKEM